MVYIANWGIKQPPTTHLLREDWKKQPLKKLAAGFLVSRDSWYLVGVLGWDSWGLFQPQIPIILFRGYIYYLGGIFVGMVPWRGPTLGSGIYIQPSLPCFTPLSWAARQVTTWQSWKSTNYAGNKWKLKHGSFFWVSGDVLLEKVDFF